MPENLVGSPRIELSSVAVEINQVLDQSVVQALGLFDLTLVQTVDNDLTINKHSASSQVLCCYLNIPDLIREIERVSP